MSTWRIKLSTLRHELHLHTRRVATMMQRREKYTRPISIFFNKASVSWKRREQQTVAPPQIRIVRSRILKTGSLLDK